MIFFLIPVLSIGAIELRMRVKSAEAKNEKLEIFWLSNHEANFDRKKHIYYITRIDEEFNVYQVPFYIFNPAWLDNTYLEELKLQFNDANKVEIDYIKLLTYEVRVE